MYQETINELLKYYHFNGDISPERLEEAICSGKDEVRNLFDPDQVVDFFVEESVATATAVIDREHGKEWNINDYVQGMVFAMLTSNRPYEPISKNKVALCKIFGDFKCLDVIQKHDPDDYTREIRKLRCGNRRIKSQMKALSHNIEVLERIENDYGSIDSFINKNDVGDLIKSLSCNGKYKLKELGIPLVCEFLKGYGVNVCKPDVHVMRFVGEKRMKWIARDIDANKPKDFFETIDIINKVSKETGYSAPFIDTLIWNFCRQESNGIGICGEQPKCAFCPSNLKMRCYYKLRD